MSKLVLLRDTDSTVVEIFMKLLQHESESQVEVTKLFNNQEKYAYLDLELNDQKLKIHGTMAILKGIASLVAVSEDDNLISPTLLQGKGDILDSCFIEQWVQVAKNDLAPLVNDPKKKGDLYRLVGFIEQHLLLNSLFVSNRISIADIFMYVHLHPVMKALNEKQKSSFSSVCRWFDFIQNQSWIKHDSLPMIDTLFPKNKLQFKFESIMDKQPANDAKGNTKGNDKSKDKKKKKKSEPKKSAQLDISVLEIKVGKVLNVKRHDNADGLFVETIDIGGENPITVCSGLVDKVPMEEIDNAAIFVCTNLKPSNMRGVTSEGMVLCATLGDDLELIKAPEGYKVGERVTVEGYSGEPDKQVNSKKLQKLFPDMKTNAEGVCIYKEGAFKIASGIVKSKLKNAIVK